MACVACDDDGDAAVVDVGPVVDSAAEPEPDVAEPEPDGGVDPHGEAIAALVAAVDMTRYAAELEYIARGPRESAGGEYWQAAQDRCAEVFLEAGLEVTRQPFFGGGVNVIGVLPGTTRPDEQLVLSGHYDSEFECIGADDDASGVAGVLEAARVLGTRRFERTLVFICFDAEEIDHHGSTDYANRARAAAHDIRGMVSLEMIGYRDPTPGSQRAPDGLDLAFPDLAMTLQEREGRGDFMLYAADDDPEMLGHLSAAAEATGLPLFGAVLNSVFRASPLAVDFQRSDHAAFWEADFPGIMLTDTADFRNPRYHCRLGEDDIASVDMEFAVLTTATVVGAFAAAAVPAEGAPVEGRVVDAAPEAPAPRPICDPLGQDCEGGQRCALLVNDTPGLSCVPPAGDPLDVDAPCARDANGGDPCAPGLVCTLTGRAPGAERRCRPLCLSVDDCPADEACPWLGFDASNCVETCDPFDDMCPQDTHCGISIDNARAEYRLTCRPTGGAGPGEACGGRTYCAPGLLCGAGVGLRALGCMAWCRVSAPTCDDGYTCRAIRLLGIEPDYGNCLPTDALR